MYTSVLFMLSQSNRGTLSTATEIPMQNRSTHPACIEQTRTKHQERTNKCNHLVEKSKVLDLHAETFAPFRHRIGKTPTHFTAFSNHSSRCFWKKKPVGNWLTKAIHRPTGSCSVRPGTPEKSAESEQFNQACRPCRNWRPCLSNWHWWKMSA